jgi:hypothetical protein
MCVDVSSLHSTALRYRFEYLEQGKGWSDFC